MDTILLKSYIFRNAAFAHGLPPCPSQAHIVHDDHGYKGHVGAACRNKVHAHGMVKIHILSVPGGMPPPLDKVNDDGQKKQLQEEEPRNR
jgi:hypothetical protein